MESVDQLPEQRQHHITGPFIEIASGLVGQYQTVIKRLGKLYEGVSGFSGATILGDGSVAMILDPVALIDSVSSSEFGENTTQPIRMQS